MRPKSTLLVALSAATTILAAVVVYASRVSEGDAPAWLSTWAVAQRATLAVALLVLTVVAAGIDVTRAVVADRLENKEVLRQLLNEFSARNFPDRRARRNRLTLLRATKGWRAWARALWRLPLFGTRHKWRAWRRISFRSTYLVVYLRATDARSPKSATALQVSDQELLCEGMAGRVWEEGYCFRGELPKLRAEDVRKVTDLSKLPHDDPIREYAEATNVRDIVLLHSFDNFGRHFMGTVIRRADATPWGILLLDSEDDTCPFLPEGTGGQFGDRFQELALALGKFVG